MRKQYAWIVLVTGTLMALPPTAFAQESRRWNPDRREDRRDRHEDVRDRREDRRDRLEDRPLEDRRDARHEGGRRDRLEDVRDRMEDRRIAGKIAAMCWKTAAIGGKIGGIGGVDRRGQLENLRRHRQHERFGDTAQP